MEHPVYLYVCIIFAADLNEENLKYEIYKYTIHENKRSEKLVWKIINDKNLNKNMYK